jgi:hypothetical protein
MTTAYTALDQVLGPISLRLAASRQHIQPAVVPELLFHYTNAAGLLGILDSARLWATNYRFLNDSSEIGHGVSLFDSIVEEKVAGASNDVVVEFLRRSRASVNAFDGMLDCYVAFTLAREVDSRSDSTQRRSV